LWSAAKALLFTKAFPRRSTQEKSNAVKTIKEFHVMKKIRGYCMAAVAVVMLMGIFAQAQDEGSSDTKPQCSKISGNKICIFTGPSGYTGSIRIASGLDNDLWFGSQSLNQIIRFTTKGGVKAFNLPSNFGGAEPFGIVQGPDNRMWFTEYALGDVGALTDAGKFSEYGFNFSPSDSISITVGSDKNLWATTDFNGILRITPKGKVTEFDLPNGGDQSQPTSLALGSDGNIWFLEANGPCFAGSDYTDIGSVTPKGHFNIYHVKNHGNGFGIASGPDNRIWFADPGGCNGYPSRIGAIGTNGKGLKYYTKGLPPLVDTIINGGDGNLYFGTFSNQIGRITPAGAVKVWNLPASYGMAILGMAVGPDGNIWFVDNAGGYIGVLYIK
jgi:virginiamycin B lyase